MSRLLEYPAIQVREWHAPIARQWLAAQYRHLGEIRLIVDGTKIGFGHQLLIACLTNRKRAIPLAWTWVKHIQGHNPVRQQLALLCYVYTPCSLLELLFSWSEIENFWVCSGLAPPGQAALVLCPAAESPNGSLAQ